MKIPFKPKISGSFSRLQHFVGRFGLVILMTVAVLMLPRPEGLSESGHHALAAFVFTAAILSLEPVSLPIAALMVPVAEVALGIATTPQAFETFSRPVVFLILASLFLAEALRKHGLTRRLAMKTIVLSGGNKGAVLFGLMGISAVFSMWVGNTATVAMLIPVALTIAKQIPEKKGSRKMLALLALGIAYSASVGGMATILGGAANAVASGFLAELGPWSFVDWMKYGIPCFILLFSLTWVMLYKLVDVPVKQLDVSPAKGQVEKMGPMSPREKEVSWVLFFTAFLWVGGPFAGDLLGLPQSLFSSAIVAVMAVSYMAVRQIITWEDVKGVSWGIFLIIGAGLSLGESLIRTGATQWFSGLIVPLVSGPHLLVTLMALVLLSALLTNLLNNTTIAMDLFWQVFFKEKKTMHILIVGAGQTGMEVIRQVRKNKGLSFMTADPRPDPPAVREGVIDKVDINEVITPLTLEEIINNTRADMILLALPTEEMGLGKAPGVDILADSLRNELSIISSVPVIEVARSTV